MQFYGSHYTVHIIFDSTQSYKAWQNDSCYDMSMWLTLGGVNYLPMNKSAIKYSPMNKSSSSIVESYSYDIKRQRALKTCTSNDNH